MLEQRTRGRHIGLRLAVAVAGLSSAALLPVSPALAQTPVASCDVAGDGGYTVGSVELAQTFSVPSATTVDAVALDLGNPFPATTGDFVVQLFLADGTGPTGPALATGTLPVDAIPDGGVNRVTIALSPAVALTAGQQYALVVTKTGTGDAVWWGRIDDPCPGQVFFRFSSADPWGPSATQDQIFVLFAAPPPPEEPQPEPGPQTKADGTLTIDANKGKVEKGRKVTLTGQLDVPSNESCEPGRQIQIQRRLKSEDDSKFQTFETVTTDAAGNYTLKVKVKKTYFYRAVVAETEACDDETSSSQKVRAQKKKAAQEA